MTIRAILVYIFVSLFILYSLQNWLPRLLECSQAASDGDMDQSIDSHHDDIIAHAIVLVDSKGVPRIHMEASDQGSRIELLSESGQIRTLIGLEEDSTSVLRFFDQHGVQTVEAVSDEKLVKLQLVSPDGSGCIALSAVTGSSLFLELKPAATNTCASLVCSNESSTLTIKGDKPGTAAMLSTNHDGSSIMSLTGSAGSFLAAGTNQDGWASLTGSSNVVRNTFNLLANPLTSVLTLDDEKKGEKREYQLTPAG